MKKIILFLLIVAITLVLFSNCGSNEETATTTTPKETTAPTYTVDYSAYIYENPYEPYDVIIFYVNTRIELEDEKQEVIAVSVKIANIEVKDNVVITRNSSLYKTDIIESDPLTFSATFANGTSEINGMFLLSEGGFVGTVTGYGNDYDGIIVANLTESNRANNKWLVKFQGKWVEQ